MRSMYSDGSYLANNPGWHQEHSTWKAGQILKMIRRNGLQPKTVCEVGCGAGEILAQLSKLLGGAVQLTGYEISKDAYAICKTKENGCIRFKNCTPFEEPGQSYDLLLAIDVAEHVEDYYGFLRNVRPKGELKILHFPLDLTVWSVLSTSSLLKLRTQVGHIHYFTKETALASLRDMGYDIHDAFYTNWAAELPTPGWKSRLVHVVRTLLAVVSTDLAARVLGGYSLMVLAK